MELQEMKIINDCLIEERKRLGGSRKANPEAYKEICDLCTKFTTKYHTRIINEANAETRLD